MSIPALKSYSLSLPHRDIRNQVNWEPYFGHALVLVHDMQAFFVDRFPKPLRDDLVANCAELINFARRRGAVIAFTAQPGSMSQEKRGLLRDFWGPGMNASEEEREIVSELRPRQEESVLTKWRYSAFFNTKLDEILRNHKIKQMFICGVYAHIGILTTALDSYSRDIETFLVCDAIADFTLEEHTQALRFAAGACAKLITVRELINVE